MCRYALAVSFRVMRAGNGSFPVQLNINLHKLLYTCIFTFSLATALSLLIIIISVSRLPINKRWTAHVGTLPDIEPRDTKITRFSVNNTSRVRFNFFGKCFAVAQRNNQKPFLFGSSRLPNTITLAMMRRSNRELARRNRT